MKMWLAIAVVVAACGDDPKTTPPDGAPEVDAPIDAPGSINFAPACVQAAQADYADAAAFGAITPGSLAGWNPDGRWFLTGVRVGGVSSFHFERRGAQIVVDRDMTNLGTIDDSAIFHRYAFTSGGTNYVIAKRVANRQPDGSFQAHRAICDGQKCTVCTAQLVRATHHGSEGTSDKLVLVGQLAKPTWGPGYTFNVRVVGTLAYLIRQDGLHIIETVDPANPIELGTWRRTGPGYSNDLKLVEAAGNKRYAIIADSPVDIVDVSNPAMPVLAAQIAEDAHTLFTERRGGKTYAYFGNNDPTSPIYDVTNPAAPVRLGRFTTEGPFVHDLSVENGVAYLNAWSAGMYAVDYTNPASPQLLGRWAGTPTKTSHSSWPTTIGGRHIALHGEESYGAHLDLVDIDPLRPTFMMPFATYKTRDHVSIHNVMAIGTKAYVTYYQDGVRVLDLSTPTAPVLLGYYNTWDPQAAYTTSAFFEGAVGLDVDISRKLIFVADSPRGLLILRDETP